MNFRSVFKGRGWQKKAGKRMLSGAISAMLIMTGSAAWVAANPFICVADSEPESRLEQLKAQDLDNLLAEAEDESQARNLLLQEIQKQAKDLNDAILKINKDLEEIRAKIADKQTEIEDASKEVETAQKTADDQLDTMKMRIRFMYENQDGGMIELIFAGKDLATVLNNIEYIGQLTSYDRERLDEYRSSVDVVKEKEEKLIEQQNELKDIEESLKKKKAQTDQEIATAQNNIVMCQDAIDRFEADKHELESQIALRDQLESEIQESRSIEASESESRSIELSQAQSIEASIQASIEASIQASVDASVEESRRDELIEKETTITESTPAESQMIPAGGNYSAQEVEMLAAMIYCEAGAESYEEMVGVGNVILNRIKSPNFPNTMQEVLFQDGQFAPAWMGWYSIVLASGTASAEAHRAAMDAIAGVNYIGDRIGFKVIPPNPSPDGIIIGKIYFFY